MTPIGQIGDDANLVEYEAWSEFIQSQNGFRMESSTGRDPATGESVELPPSPRNVLYSKGDTDIGMLVYDENHRAVIVFCLDEFADTIGELGTRLADDLERTFNRY